MNSFRWQKVEELFHAALELDPGERETFLNDACNGDSELRHEVQTLVAAVNQKSEFMNQPAMEMEARAMSVEPSGALSGRRVAHYLIGPLLGVGGMAEVYRARDSRLDRDVAIKVLLESPSLDAVGLGRFKREARILASITHPNVAAVFGFEQVDDMCALVMELIEGETLSDRIARERLSADDAIAIAIQIAAAVEAAHSREIVHRDLKPSNIRLARDGTVKVLDFGIAKILQPSGGSDPSNRTTFSTQAAAIVGTVAYMSPEQARGQRVGHSTDVWAWGCVLYEMLSGKRAFDGSAWTDMIARIVSEDPDWTKLPADTPFTVRSLIEDCLQKDSTRRPRDIGEVRRRLENVQAKPGPPAPAAEIALSLRSARALFLGIQFGCLAMYFAALFYVNKLELDTVLLGGVIVTAMLGIAVRLFLISSVMLAHPAAGRKFNRIFPLLLLLDGAWAASPLLAVPAIRYGVALAGVAALAYLPFSQRTLMHRIYGPAK
ncbi:MAG TPA: serine/threonine-protein kinase [Terriglobia bacterium]|nr:serine/threonine-protein kinase [Terriglobia bacterium]